MYQVSAPSVLSCDFSVSKLPQSNEGSKVKLIHESQYGNVVYCYVRSHSQTQEILCVVRHFLGC